MRATAIYYIALLYTPVTGDEIDDEEEYQRKK